MPSEKPRIVFINQATGYLTIDIVNAFVECGQFAEVALVAGSIRVQDVPLDPSVQWSRVALYDRGNPRRKLISWLKGTLQIGWLLLTRYRHHDVFYITIPPVAYLWSLFLPNRFSVLVFDVYPDVLAIYQVSQNNPVYRIWSWANRRLFKRAHRVYTLGEGMAALLGNYMRQERVHIVPNWSGLRRLRRIQKDQNAFVHEQGLEQKFVVQYSGNIGYTHNVEVLIDLARKMHQHDDVFFLIIGRGERFLSLKQQVERDALRNCRLLPFQPDDRLNETLSAADLGVVILDDKTAHVSMPSKIYNLQAVGVPVLGIAALESELARHVLDNAIGECFHQSDLAGMMEFVLELKSDPLRLEQLKENATKVGGRFTWKNASRYASTYVQELA